VGIENTGLYNGTEFKDPFLNTDGSFRYYNGFDYTRGSVTYNNQTYSNVLLKYDLLEDKLLTRSDDNLGLFNVTLIPEKVYGFSIYGHDFIRLADTNTGFSGNGFFETAFVGDALSLYIKHIKKKKDRALRTGVQYRFKNDNFYLLKTKTSYFVVNSVRDVRKTLPENEGEIKDFYKSYRALYKSNRDGFMIKLIKYLDGLKEKPNQ
jgi:hypothetical protein